MAATPKKANQGETKKTGNAARVSPARNKKRSRLATWGFVLGLVAVIYVGMAGILAGTVPPGASLGGVEIGGLGAQEALRKLHAELEPRLQTPIRVKLGEKTALINPLDAGLQPDFARTVRAATGFSLNPARVIAHLTGEGALQLESKVNQQQLLASLGQIAPRLKTAPQEATFRCVGSVLKPVNPVPGRELALAAAAQVIAREWWRVAENPGQPGGKSGGQPGGSGQPGQPGQPNPDPGSAPAIDLPEANLATKTTREDLDEAKSRAKTLTKSPVKINVEGKSLEIPPTEICQNVTWGMKSGKLTPSLKGEKIREYILARLPGVEREPFNARYRFEAGKPTVVPAVNGSKLTPQEAARIISAAISSQKREINVKLEAISPEFSTAQAEKAGIKEIIGEFDTPLTSDQARTGNLVKAAQILTGQIVKAGGKFSLEKSLGDISVENGWVPSGVIDNGVHTTALGGGLSQMCVTALNAAWFAGMDLIEFHPHSVWISRYPMGRECTLWTGTLDLKWKNPNPNPVVLNSWVAGGRLHVQLWGTKYYQVKSSQSDQSNVRQPGTKVSDWSGCVPSAAGHPGFTIANTRERWLNDKLYDTKTYTHTYQPDDRVECAKDQPKPPSGSASGSPADTTGETR